MKKTVLFALLCATVVLTLAGCGTTKNEFDVGEKSNVEVVNGDVSLSIEDGTLTDTGAVLVLKNDSSEAVEYGNSYEVEIKQDNSWHEINVEIDFDLASYTTQPNEAAEIVLDWENGYGKLAPGDYRIIKSIDVEKAGDSFETYYVSAEFTIE